MPDLFRVMITDRALGCLQEIFRFIEHESPQNAAEVIVEEVRRGTRRQPRRFD